VPAASLKNGLMASPMSVWFCSRRPAVALNPADPSAKVTIARRVHVTWSSQSLRIWSWNATCSGVRSGCTQFGAAGVDSPHE
jgi:hypothetical protein